MQRTKFRILWHLGWFYPCPTSPAALCWGRSLHRPLPASSASPSLFPRVSLLHGGHPCSVASDRVAPKGGPGRRCRATVSQSSPSCQPSTAGLQQAASSGSCSSWGPAPAPLPHARDGEWRPSYQPRALHALPLAILSQVPCVCSVAQTCPFSATPWTVVCQAPGKSHHRVLLRP